MLHLPVCPNPADGVVGIADDHRLHAILQFFLKGLEVYAVIIILMVQRTVHQCVAAVLNSCKKGIIYRCKYQDLPSLWHHCVQGKINTCDHAVAQQHPVRLGLPLVAALPPSLDCRVHAVQRLAVPDDRMIAAFLDGIQDFRYRRKIRICYPERQQPVLLSKCILLVPLNAGCSSAVNCFVKIVHNHISFLYWYWRQPFLLCL